MAVEVEQTGIIDDDCSAGVDLVSIGIDVTNDVRIHAPHAIANNQRTRSGQRMAD